MADENDFLVFSLAAAPPKMHKECKFFPFQRDNASTSNPPSRSPFSSTHNRPSTSPFVNNHGLPTKESAYLPYKINPGFLPFPRSTQTPPSIPVAH